MWLAKIDTDQLKAVHEPRPWRQYKPRDWTQASHIVGRCFTIWATKEVWRKKS